MLVHKGGQINNVQLITGLRIAEISQRQGEGGGYVQRKEVIVKRKKGGQGGCEWRSEAFVKIQKKIYFFFFFLGGGGGGGSGWMGTEK